MARWKAVRAEVRGFKQVHKNLHEVREKIEREINRIALRKAVKPALRQAKANARESDDTGTLRRSIGVKLKTYKRKGKVVIYAGPRTNKARTGPDGRKRDPIKYGHLIELGTKHGVEGTHFMERAFTAKKGEGFDIYVGELRIALPKAVRRVERRNRGKKRRG